MENLFLTADQSQGRLNFSNFTNIEKALPESEIGINYPNCVVLEKAAVDGFIRDVYESTGGDIQKGGFNDNDEVKDFIAKAESQLKALKPLRVSNGKDVRTVYLLEKAKEDTFKKGGNDAEDTLEKGMVGEALGGYGADIKFKKKGSEIVAKIAVEKSLLTSKCATLEEEIQDLLEKISCKPTQECKRYDSNYTCPYKIFDWNMTYYESQVNSMSPLDHQGKTCSSQEEADLHREYNNKVYEYVECQSECKIIEMYEENLSPNQSYELTARQMISLGF